MKFTLKIKSSTQKRFDTNLKKKKIYIYFSVIKTGSEYFSPYNKACILDIYLLSCRDRGLLYRRKKRIVS